MDSSRRDPIPSEPHGATSADGRAFDSPQDNSSPTAAKAEKARRIGRIAGQWFAALSAFTLAAGLYLNAFHLNDDGLAYFALLGLVALPLVLIAGVTWALVGLEGRRKLAGYALVPLGWAAYVGVFKADVGVRLAAFISRPALVNLAERVRAGESIQWPTRAGLFVVVGSRTKGPIVALVTKDESSGYSALVHFPDGPLGDPDLALAKSRDFYGPMYNLEWNVALGGGWRYQDED